MKSRMNPLARASCRARVAHFRYLELECSLNGQQLEAPRLSVSQVTLLAALLIGSAHVGRLKAELRPPAPTSRRGQPTLRRVDSYRYPMPRQTISPCVFSAFFSQNLFVLFRLFEVIYDPVPYHRQALVIPELCPQRRETTSASTVRRAPFPGKARGAQPAEYRRRIVRAPLARTVRCRWHARRHAGIASCGRP